jgi:hypothetical protein
MKGYHDDLLMSIGMCCFVGMTSFRDLEKSKGQAKAMIDSWSITTTNSEDIGELDEVINGFIVDKVENTQTLQNTKEHLWLFNGLFGFKSK